MRVKNVVAVAAAFLCIGTIGTAATISLDSVVGTWSNTVGGTGVVENTLQSGYNRVLWGVPANSGGQSGLGFQGATNPSIPLLLPFQVGNLQHYNRPIGSGTAATSTQLNLQVGLTIYGNPVSEGPFNFAFQIDETPNQTPCVYPSSTPCADRITFTNLSANSAFTIGGIDYILQLTGFSNDGGATLQTQFISNEGANNVIGMYGVLTARDPGLPEPIPEPATMLLIGAGLATLGVLRRRKAQA